MAQTVERSLVNEWVYEEADYYLLMEPFPPLILIPKEKGTLKEL